MTNKIIQIGLKIGFRCSGIILSTQITKMKKQNELPKNNAKLGLKIGEFEEFNCPLFCVAHKLGTPLIPTCRTGANWKSKSDTNHAGLKKLLDPAYKTVPGWVVHGPFFSFFLFRSLIAGLKAHRRPPPQSRARKSK